MPSSPRTRLALMSVYGFVAVLGLVLLTLLLITVVRPARADGFSVTSPDIQNGKIADDFVFDGFGCTGKNTSPGINWSGAPTDTKSFAVTVYDPDAPTGSGWWHWVIYNIPGNSDGVPTGMGSGAMGIPKHVRQAANDYGAANYGGPCPPKGDKPHRYIFTVYAMPVEKLDVPDGASAAMIGFNLKANKLAEASFTATYGR